VVQVKRRVDPLVLDLARVTKKLPAGWKRESVLQLDPERIVDKQWSRDADQAPGEVGADAGIAYRASPHRAVFGVRSLGAGAAA